MLHIKNIESHDTGNVSNVTIISIMYLLQKTGELLQEIQVSHFCNSFHYSTTNIYSTTTTTITAQTAMIKW